VNSDKPLRTVRGSGQSRDGNRRGIRRQNGFGLQDRAKLRKYLALDLLVFHSGFNDKISVCKKIEFFDRLDPVERGRPLVFGNQRFTDLSCQIAVNRSEPRFDPLHRNVAQSNVEAGECTHMCNTAAHLA